MSTATRCPTCGYLPATPALDQAKQYLQETLSAGPVAAKLLHDNARAAGIKHVTMNRARKELGIIATQRQLAEGGKEWWCALPGGDPFNP